MSYYRSYLEKNNTIIKNSYVNTSKSPTTELFYGSSYSRFIFKIDLTDLKNKIDNGYLVLNNDTKHYLNLYNCITGDNSLIGQTKNNTKNRATSFDLTLYKLNQSWDEGFGYDSENNVNDFPKDLKTYTEVPSNWYNSNTLSGWTYEGSFSTGSTIITNIHFDNGNENLYADITNYINDVLTGNTTDYGLGLKFRTDYENSPSSIDQSVSFFTKYTQTFYEPFVESIFNDRIIDNRHNFIDKMEQNLYLYVNKNTNPFDLDSLPIVDILDSQNNVIDGLSNITSTKVKKGVYKVSFAIDGIVCDGKKFLYDKWKNIEIDNVTLSDITQKFIPKPFNEQFFLGSYSNSKNKYIIQYQGIKQNEKIKQGENRKITILFKSFNTQKNESFENVYYRLFIKEGKTDVIIHDWTYVDMSFENHFNIDTSYLIPREYTLEIKSLINSEELIYNNQINFTIINIK